MFARYLGNAIECLKGRSTTCRLLVQLPRPAITAKGFKTLHPTPVPSEDPPINPKSSSTSSAEPTSSKSEEDGTTFTLIDEQYTTTTIEKTDSIRSTRASAFPPPSPTESEEDVLADRCAEDPLRAIKRGVEKGKGGAGVKEGSGEVDGA